MTAKATVVDPMQTRASPLILSAVLTLTMLAVPPGARAHHSFAMFDANQTLSATATVKEFQWGSPHTWIELVILNEDKAAKPLSLELTTISGLMRNGWKPKTLKPGDKITVTYHPMRDGTAAGQLVELVTEDGKTLKGQ